MHVALLLKFVLRDWIAPHVRLELNWRTWSGALRVERSSIVPLQHGQCGNAK